MRIRCFPRKFGTVPGLTLLELSIVILVLLAFIAVMFIGARSWKRGTDRAACIMNLRQVQLAVRSYANTQGLDEDIDVGLLSPAVNLPAELFGPDKFIERQPLCPAGGLYVLDGDHIPPRGALYMNCTLALSLNHVPDKLGAW